MGGSKPWQTDTMGTVFKEDTQIHKHTYVHTISKPIADEEYKFSNQFISGAFIGTVKILF